MYEVARVTRRRQVSDGAGGSTDSWDSVGTTACRVSGDARGGQSVIADRTASTIVVEVKIPPDADVKASDRLEIGARRFEVLAIAFAAPYITAVATCAVMQ